MSESIARPVAPQEADERGRQVARDIAGWYLGDRSWADTFINAYLNPEPAAQRLREAKADL